VVAARYVETNEFIGMLQRMVRAAGRRAATGDEDDLARLLELQVELDAAVITAVRGLRAAGWTWSALGAATGTSKEAAVQKWAAKVKAPGPDAAIASRP
jgi:predicted DNA-binding protein (UPF0278 family)